MPPSCALLRTLVVAVAVMLPCSAESIAPTLAAKIIKAGLSSETRIAGVRGELAQELKKLGVNLDPGAPVAWADSEADARALARKGKFVICPHGDWWEAGAALAIVPEGGRPTLLLHGANARRSGFPLADSVKRIAKAVN